MKNLGVGFITRAKDSFFAIFLGLLCTSKNVWRGEGLASAAWDPSEEIRGGGLAGGMDRRYPYRFEEIPNAPRSLLDLCLHKLHACANFEEPLPRLADVETFGPLSSLFSYGCGDYAEFWINISVKRPALDSSGRWRKKLYLQEELETNLTHGGLSGGLIRVEASQEIRAGSRGRDPECFFLLDINCNFRLSWRQFERVFESAFESPPIRDLFGGARRAKVVPFTAKLRFLYGKVGSTFGLLNGPKICLFARGGESAFSRLASCERREYEKFGVKIGKTCDSFFRRNEEPCPGLAGQRRGSPSKFPSRGRN